MKTFKQFLRDPSSTSTAKPGSLRLTDQQKQKLVALIKQYKFRQARSADNAQSIR